MSEKTKVVKNSEKIVKKIRGTLPKNKIVPLLQKNGERSEPKKERQHKERVIE